MFGNTCWQPLCPNRHVAMARDRDSKQSLRLCWQSKHWERWPNHCPGAHPTARGTRYHRAHVFRESSVSSRTITPSTVRESNLTMKKKKTRKKKRERGHHAPGVRLSYMCSEGPGVGNSPACPRAIQNEEVPVAGHLPLKKPTR